MSDRMWDKISFKCMVNKKAISIFCVCFAAATFAMLPFLFSIRHPTLCLRMLLFRQSHPSGPQHLQIARHS